jgi:hypothetical protein
MSPAQFATLIRYYTGTNSTTFTDAEILVLANVFKDDIAKEIAKKNEDYFGMKFVRNLQAGIRSYGMPDEVLNNIKYVEAKLDGTAQKRLYEIDLTEYKRATDEATIREQFANREPAFDIFARAIWIFSGEAIIDVEDGLILWAIIFPADITNLASTIDMATDPSDTSHGFPRQFHELLARRVSIAYKTAQDRPIPLSEKEKLYEYDLGNALSAISGMNLDRSVNASVPQDDGQNY